MKKLFKKLIPLLLIVSLMVNLIALEIVSMPMIHFGSYYVNISNDIIYDADYLDEVIAYRLYVSNNVEMDIILQGFTENGIDKDLTTKVIITEKNYYNDVLKVSEYDNESFGFFGSVEIVDLIQLRNYLYDNDLRVKTGKYELPAPYNDYKLMRKTFKFIKMK